ncbi:ImmA/IrrE family metallo-endopeptidase [Tabrizicola sp.]|uniref:ImmA/IrrE family metallo-endopeptidase n=1 Tax=Tabrizicola sp. TaxID=2005166 RepID=UPI002733EF9A|nr:ImmA/IrrE family metallo-endopeptidase [Tabrizicola sp.]MDP3194152.1 ImmA/IrrE family metallo-endopeptidase [Tabrizicola sp.]
MTENFSPQRWANTLTQLLNSVHGAAAERFPVQVPELAKEYSRQRFPDDPVSLVAGDSLPTFDGALYKAPPGKKGWGIIYNNAIASPGRINFTIAHEFGHYLLHRLRYPDGIECGQQDITRWDSEYRQIEIQANEFAAGLLMPLDDFRRQIDGRAKPTLIDIGACAERYGVSLIAAALRWLQYTERRSVLVVSRDGFVLWARSSSAALRSHAFFKTAGRPPIPVPASSLAAQPELLEKSRGELSHDGGVWFSEPCEEIVLASDQYDFTVSLVHLETVIRVNRSDEPEEDKDAFDFMTRHLRGAS